MLLTADDMVRRAHYRNAQRTLERLLSLDVVPVVNENDTVATDEIRFGDNDRLAALVAHLVGAEALVLLSDVDGLYDGDPRRPGARLIPEVRDAADLAEVRIAGAGGVRCRHRRDGDQDHRGGDRVRRPACPVLLAAAAAGRPPRWTRRADGPKVGTAFRPSRRRMSARGSGCATPPTPRGPLDLDRGAVDGRGAPAHARCSPPGDRRVAGDFVAGDVVDLSARTAPSSPAAWSGSTPPSCRS